MYFDAWHIVSQKYNRCVFGQWKDSRACAISCCYFCWSLLQSFGQEFYFSDFELRLSGLGGVSHSQSCRWKNLQCVLHGHPSPPLHIYYWDYLNILILKCNQDSLHVNRVGRAPPPPWPRGGGGGALNEVKYTDPGSEKAGPLFRPDLGSRFQLCIAHERYQETVDQASDDGRLDVMYH